MEENNTQKFIELDEFIEKNNYTGKDLIHFITPDIQLKFL